MVAVQADRMQLSQPDHKNVGNERASALSRNDDCI